MSKLSKTEEKIFATAIIIAVIALSTYAILEINEIPPVVPVDYDFISIDNCETLNNISEYEQEDYLILLNSSGCEGDYSITYSTSANLSSVDILFNITFSSNYSFIGFNFYISNASNLELLNLSTPVNLTVFNNETDNTSTCWWQFDDLEVGCNNLTAEYDEINITDENITNIVITIRSGKNVQAGAYCIDNIYVLRET